MSYNYGGVRGYGGMPITESVRLAERALGRALKRPEQVHHVNEDKLDDRPENLVICPNAAYHALLHIRTRALRESGNANLRSCGFCGKYDDPELMYDRAKRNPNGSFIHRSCHAEYERKRRAKT